MKHLSFLFSALVALITFCSCSQDAEQAYSCNEEVNSWIKSHKSEIARMTRSDWKNASATTSRAIYVAFSQKQKIQFWMEKFAEVQKLSWSSDEKKHIAKLIAFVSTHPNFFRSEALSDEELDELDLFFYKWKNEAIEKLGWTETLCIAIAGSGKELLNKNGELAETTGLETGPDLNPNIKWDCECNLKNDFCNFPSSAQSCTNRNCTELVKGCGWLCAQTCNGLCF